MDREELKKRVADYILKNDQVTYVELEWLFRELGWDYRGDIGIASPECGNVLLWSGWNKETADTMCEVLKEYPVHREPADPLVYILDGGGMDLPLVKRHMAYKTDHWLPVVFCKGKTEKRESK